MEKTVITVRLNPREVAFLDRVAAEEGVSRGEILRGIITAVRKAYDERNAAKGGEGSPRPS